MDAHAWVEAWDIDQQQWTVVEATVGEDMGMVTDAEDLEHLAGGGNVLGRLIEVLYQYGLFGLPSWLFESYGIVGGLLPPAVLLGVALCLASLRRRRRRVLGDEMRPGGARSPELVLLHKMLSRMDHRVDSAGHRRDVGETLHAFSRRLREKDSGDGLWTAISDWYIEYANLRYCRTLCSERLHRLTRKLHDSI
jgi:hypothetical protein